MGISSIAGVKLRLLELRYTPQVYCMLSFFSRWLNSVGFVRRGTLPLTYNDNSTLVRRRPTYRGQREKLGSKLRLFNIGTIQAMVNTNPDNFGQQLYMQKLDIRAPFSFF